MHPLFIKQYDPPHGRASMGRVARIYKTLSVGQVLTMDSTIVLFKFTLAFDFDPG